MGGSLLRLFHSRTRPRCLCLTRYFPFQGYELVNLSVNGEPNVVCQLPPPSDEAWWTSIPWVWVFISLGSAILLIAFFW